MTEKDLLNETKNKSTIGFNYGFISKSRNVLFGLATFWIAVFHSEIVFSFQDGEGIRHFLYVLLYNLYFIKSLGFIGVDIFFFLSAMGLYFSLEKNDGLIGFYKKRFRRIVPEYLLVSLIWGVLRKVEITRFFSELVGISFVMKGDLNHWFIIAILILYLIYPALYKISKKYSDNIVLLIIPVIILLNYLISRCFPPFFSNVYLALRRLPVFLLGSYFAKRIKESTNASPVTYVLVVVSAVLSFRFIANEDNINTVYYHYICGMAGIVIIFLLSYIYCQAKKLRILSLIFVPLQKLGSYSLETYLLYEKVLYVIQSLHFFENSVITASVSFIICLLLSVILKKTLDFFVFKKRASVL